MIALGSQRDVIVKYLAGRGPPMWDDQEERYHTREEMYQLLELDDATGDAFHRA